MKKIYLPLSIIALLFCGRVSAQDWVSMMKDGKTNVHDVQAAFYKWYNAHKTAAVKDKDSDKPGEDNDEDGNYEMFKRWESYMVPRTYPSGNIPDQAKIAKDFQDFLTTHSHDRTIDRTMAAAKWSYAGISNTPKNGEAGRVNRVRFDPTNSSIVYACSPSGGLWKSTNGGKNWSCNTDGLADLATSDVAIDPSNTNIMYLATGDGDGIGGGETTPSTIGVLKSIDGGKTWNPTGLYYTLQNSGPAVMTVNQLLINPSNPNTVLAATSFGLYITFNAGVSWYETQSGDIKDMEFEPSHPSIVYASTSTAQFYRSTNGGQSFTAITIPSSSGAGRMAIAVTPADSNYVYLLADNASSFAFFAVWRSTNSGQTFTRQSTSPNLLGFSSTGSDAVGQGWYTLSLAASPTNANEIIVGGVNVWRSVSGGTSWKLNADQTGTGAPYIHADIHNLAYLPTGGTSYYAANDGGVFETTNSGTAWTDYSNGLEIAEQYSIGLSASSATLWLTGWQDNGTNLANAGAWNETMGGDGMMCFIDNTNNNNMYGEQYQGSFNRSTNGGGTWHNISISTTESAGWVTPWCQDPTTANTIYAGYENIWKSTNQGTNWSAISTWGSGGVNIVAIAVAPSNDKYIYAATTGKLEMTSNGGTSWTNVTSGIPTGSGAISCVTVDPKNPLRVWVTLQGYTAGSNVFQSVTGGTKWTNISNGLPTLPVNTICYQKGGTADAMYVGTDMGVYYRDTTNTGGNWVSYNVGLPNVMIADLKFYAPNNTLMAATYGRGTWSIPAWTPAGTPPVAHFTAFPANVCTGSYVQFTDTSSNNPTSWSWTLTGATPSTSTLQNPNVQYNAAGSYPVKMVAKNASGSDSLTVSGYIYVRQTPAPPTITVNGSLLSATPSNYPYYQWYKSTTIVPGADRDSLWVASKGVYKVYITDTDGCSNFAQVVISVLGVNNLTVDNEINVYPNPTNGAIQLVFNGQEPGDYDLQLSNILGQTVYTEKIHLSGTYNSSLNLSNYGKGIYFLSLTGNNSRTVKKIVVY